MVNCDPAYRALLEGLALGRGTTYFHLQTKKMKYGDTEIQHITDKESETGSCPQPHAELATGLETEPIQPHHPVFLALHLNAMWPK